MSDFDRLCIFKKDNLPVVVELSVEPGLVVSVDFMLYSPDKKKLVEKWNFSTHGGINKKYQIETSTLKLDKHILVWKIISFGASYEYDEGNVHLEFRQLDFKCIMNRDTDWEIENLMPLSTKIARKITDTLLFVGHEPETIKKY